jgi:hypothetical protein
MFVVLSLVIRSWSVFFSSQISSLLPTPLPSPWDKETAFPIPAGVSGSLSDSIQIFSLCCGYRFLLKRSSQHLVTWAISDRFISFLMVSHCLSYNFWAVLAQGLSVQLHFSGGGYWSRCGLGSYCALFLTSQCFSVWSLCLDWFGLLINMAALRQ